MTVKELQKYNYNYFIIELTNELANKTVKDILSILKSILCYANSEYNCNIDINKITSPKTSKNKINILSKRERRRLEKYCIQQNELKSIGILMSLNTGIRIGELCALKWQDIDLERKQINVKYTLQRVYNNSKNKTKILIDTPKTLNSVRTIPISNKLYEMIKPLKRKNNDENFFLTGDKEKCIEPRTYQRYFKNILQSYKLKPYRFHILRHTFASNCVEVGMDPKSLSEMLGHANVEITLNKYVHSNYRIQKKFLEKL